MTAPSMLRRPRMRACAAEGFDCGGHGYHELRAIESVGAHFKRKGETARAIVTRIVRFKAPCICRAGEGWLRRHA